MNVLANERLSELESKANVLGDEIDNLERAMEKESNSKKAEELQNRLELLTSELDEITEEIAEIQESME